MATPARQQIDTGYFFQQIVAAERSTLVLDFHSTLRLASPRSSALPIPTIDELLECIIMARRTRVILLSSTAAQDVLAELRPPFPEIWGRDGSERVLSGGDVAVPLCIHPRETVPVSSLLMNLCAGGPVAYVVGESGRAMARNRILVRPQYHLTTGAASLGAPEDLVQFLVDWLRACAGEIC